MFGLQNTKTIPLIGPVTVATNADTTNLFDWGIFNEACIRIRLNPTSATNSSGKATVCKLEESDSTSGPFVSMAVVNQSTTVAGYSGTTNTVAVSTSNEFVLPVHNDTSEAQVINLHVARGGARKRYVKLSLRAPTSFNTVYAEAILARGEAAPDTATERGDDATVLGG